MLPNIKNGMRLLEIFFNSGSDNVHVNFDKHNSTLFSFCLPKYLIGRLK